MIHEALILEYSGRHLALLEWAASLKLFAYSCIGLALFFPWGIAEAQATAGDAAGAAGAGRSSSRSAASLLALLETLTRQDAHLPRARVPRHRVPAGGDRHAGPHAARRADDDAPCPLSRSSINLLGARAAAARVRDALAAPHPVADPPVHAAGR